mgnify:CR=1 FL=1
MKTLLAVLMALAFIGSAIAEPFDYTKIKPEHYKNLADKSEFTDKNGEKFKIKNTNFQKGLYIQITSNGRKQWKKHGVFYSIRSDGTVYEMVTYSFGKKDGLKESYNNKGIVKFRYYYKNNQKHGSWTQFNDKGVKVSEATYEYDLEQGKVYNYSNGKLHFEKDYVDGKRHGEVLQYNTSSGKLVARSQYNKGKKIGKTQWY